MGCVGLDELIGEYQYSGEAPEQVMHSAQQVKRNLVDPAVSTTPRRNFLVSYYSLSATMFLRNHLVITDKEVEHGFSIVSKIQRVNLERYTVGFSRLYVVTNNPSTGAGL